MSAFAREELLGHVPGFNGAAGPPPAIPRYRQCVYVDMLRRAARSRWQPFFLRALDC
jgi:hypothetical protein